MCDDVKRLTDLMALCDLRFARANGAWMEDGHVAIQVNPPFSKALGVTLTSAPDPFVVVAASDNTMVRTLAKLLADMGRSQTCPATPATAPAEVETTQADIDRIGRRFNLPDGRWFTVQERFFRGVEQAVHPERWEARFKPNPKRLRRAHGAFWTYPVFAGFRDGEVVAYIMPRSIPCNLQIAIRPAVRAVTGGGGVGG